jgi:hypothetical protein
MTENMLKEIESTENERKLAEENIEAEKAKFAKILSEGRENIIYDLEHPKVPGKKEIRRFKIASFIYRIKKAIGL